MVSAAVPIEPTAQRGPSLETLELILRARTPKAMVSRHRRTPQAVSGHAQKAMLFVVAAHGPRPLSQTLAARMACCSPVTASDALNALELAGAVEVDRLGGAKGKVYTLRLGALERLGGAS